jgi:pre-mRNA-processing factor SLU7
VVPVSDVAVPELPLDYAAKHDRWNGYDASQFKGVVERYQKMEDIRQKAKAEAEIKRLLAAEATAGDPDAAAAAVAAAAAAVSSGAAADESDSDDFKVADDPRAKTTSRNIRTREDTAKYLRNLDVGSAYFDPKTRSMRENPTPNIDPSTAVYAGDNFVRYTGDAQEFASVQRFAWEASNAQQTDAAAASTLVLAANPSQVELLHKQFKEKKATLLQRRREEILDKYGGAEHLDSNQTHEAQLAATERYVEYDAQGRVIKGLEKGKVKSKYEEDVYPGNHTAVWGSYWNAGRWGFKCCHSYVKSSYCLGAAGIRAAAAELRIEAPPPHGADAAAAAEPLSLMAQLNAMTPEEREKLEKQKRKRAEKEEKERKSRYKAAVAEEKMLARKRLIGDVDADIDTRPRSAYGDQSEANAEVTKEQLEAYQKHRYHSDDPMAKFLAEEHKNDTEQKNDTAAAKRPKKSRRDDSSDSSSDSSSGSYSSSSSSSSGRHRKKKSRSSKKKKQKKPKSKSSRKK